MVHLGTFHNATTGLPLERTDDGHLVPDASVEEIHEDAKRAMRDQIRHGVLADDLGYDSLFLSEHHAQTMGQEVSTNPLQTLTAIAARTDSLRLGQASCILPWYEPVRFAEQAALLDVVSDGRAEIGIGRGYQPREAELMGQYWGGGVQNQPQNYESFEEKYEIVRKAWTEDVFSYDGEYHSVPPKGTKWHHEQEKAYYESDACEYDLDDVIDWTDSNLYASDGPNEVVSGGSTLDAVSVYPQPEQSPHPQLWQPAFSPRSMKFAAERGINGFYIGLPNDALEDAIGAYYQFAEQAGWPDHRPEYDGEPFAFGWDERRNRGVAVTRYVFNTDAADAETLDRWKRGLENQWNYYAPLGLLGAVSGLDYEEATAALREHGADLFVEKGVAIVGDADHIRDEVSSIVEECGLDGLNFQPAFEVNGVGGEAVDDQLRAFGEDVAPYLREQFPGPTEEATTGSAAAADGGSVETASASTASTESSPERSAASADLASDRPDAPTDGEADTSLDADELVAGVVARAERAMDAIADYDQAATDELVRAVGWAAYRDDHVEPVARAAVEDTAIGNVSDKVYKVKRQVEGTLADLRDAPSVGVVERDPERGVREVAKPVGVVGAFTPSTNPVATVPQLAMLALKGRNAVVFSPSPQTRRACAELVEHVREELAAVGAPADLVQVVPGEIDKPKAHALMERADLLQVTGSQNNVEAGQSSGTPNYSVGAGNVVSVVDETADIAQVAEFVGVSKPLDDGATCVNVNSLVAESSVADELRTALEVAGGYYCDDAERDRVEETLFRDGHLDRRAIASDAGTLAEMAGIDRAADADFLVVDGEGVGERHPLSGEKLAPVLTVYEAPDFSAALDLTQSIVEYEGIGHSCTIHTSEDDRAERMGKAIDVGRVLVNQPSLCLAGAENNDLDFTLSLGGGTWAGNQFDDNLGYEYFLNFTTVAEDDGGRLPDREDLFGDYPVAEERPPEL
ncbi:LLM class flavin-dependent oxidoreductase [Halorussus gelatinilyticus]|uniref:LLM class flavin-dependent oxidoreductase n=1 Tax=Halorussus gelatinilyticus TaxID=2937524 RepID=A0A8U0IDL9_9EURY|nr:LLM class flavin-dependent oxidoreductase [Halorussus gelatinilyticus]UPV98864.1 LLM class flavin-dependent oxidoreductase [Halorussus gelatinilyticus]